MRRHLPRFTLLFAALLAGVACSVSGKYDAAELGDSGLTTGVTGTQTSDSGLGTTTNAPVFFAITGGVAVNNDDLEVGQSTLTFSYRNAEGSEVCSSVRVISEATTLVNEDPDVPLFGWWQLALDTSASCPYGPESLTLGVGAWDSELDAPAAAQNLDGSQLYAVYAQQSDTSPVFAFGAGGTSEQFSGTTPPVTAAPQGWCR